VRVLKYRCFFTCIYLSVIIKMFSRKTWWKEITNCVKCFSWIAFSISNRQAIDLACFIASAVLSVLSVVWHLTFVNIWKTLFLKVYAKNFTGWGTIPRADCHCRQVCNLGTTDRHLRGNCSKVMVNFPSEMGDFENHVSVETILQSVLEMYTIVISSTSARMMSTWIWLWFEDCVSLELVISGLLPVNTHSFAKMFDCFFIPISIEFVAF